MAKNRVRTCSSKNCKEKYFANGFCRRHYKQTPKYKAYDKAYNQTPEAKAKQKARRATPE